VRFAAKQNAHRPGPAPAPGLRAEVVLPLYRRPRKGANDESLVFLAAAIREAFEPIR
jgi:hypothetical protein